MKVGGLLGDELCFEMVLSLDAINANQRMLDTRGTMGDWLNERDKVRNE